MVGGMAVAFSPAGGAAVLILIEVPQQVPPAGEEFAAARAGMSASVDVLVLVVGSRVPEYLLAVRAGVQPSPATAIGCGHRALAAGSIYGVAQGQGLAFPESTNTTTTAATTLFDHRRPGHHQRASP